MLRVSALLGFLLPLLLLLIDCTSSFALRSPSILTTKFTDDFASVANVLCPIEDQSPFCDLWRASHSVSIRSTNDASQNPCTIEDQSPFCMAVRSLEALIESHGNAPGDDCPLEDQSPFCMALRSRDALIQTHEQASGKDCPLEDQSPFCMALRSSDTLIKSNGASDEDYPQEDQSPFCFDRLCKRDDSGAACPSTDPDQAKLHSIKPDDTLQNGYEYRICCPDGYLHGTFDLSGPTCCFQDNSQNPTGCDIADRTLVLPASVNNCDKSWKKEKDKASKIQVCQRKL